MGAGGLALAGTAWSLLKDINLKDEQRPAWTKGGKNVQTPTYCEICFWKCAGWVHTDNEGRIKKITGNDVDPHCNGRLCPRGTGGVGMFYDEDRLKTPLIRTQERGKQVFREATWDEAFEYIVKKMNCNQLNDYCMTMNDSCMTTVRR